MDLDAINNQVLAGANYSSSSDDEDETAEQIGKKPNVATCCPNP